MINLITFCLLTSFKILAIHVACWKGNILFMFRNMAGFWLYKGKVTWLEKPLYDCLPCMSSFWGLFFWAIGGMEFHPFSVILIVCGINIILQRIVPEIPKE